MNVALMIGRKGSQGLPGKNLKEVLGRPLMNYPWMAARNSSVECVYLSTDDEAIATNGKHLGMRLIERPPELATNEALAEDAFRHGFQSICKDLKREPKYVVLLFCNGVTITPGIIDEGLQFLDQHEDYDSAITVSRYNMWSPARAKRIVDDVVVPFYGEEVLREVTCDRGSQGDVFYADCSAFVVRPRCFDYDTHGVQPFRWFGRRAYPLKQWGGLDLDEHWQIPMARYWLEQHGFSEATTPYETDQ